MAAGRKRHCEGQGFLAKEGWSKKNMKLNLILGLLLMTAVRVGAAETTWLPVGGGVVPVTGFVVDGASRAEVQSFYNTVYLASKDVDGSMGWTGSYDSVTGTVGTTSAVYREHVRRRVNFYRGMVGLPADITFGEFSAVNDVPGPVVPAGTSKTVCAMEASYMNVVESMYAGAEGTDFVLSHDPPNTYYGWTARAWNACAYSNLAIGYWGPEAIDAYMLDDGIGESDLYNNVNVGHRRWLLFPRGRDMASGDVPAGVFRDGADRYDVYGASSVYVVANFKPAGAARFTKWPNEGYCPVDVVPSRWSLAWPGADFSGAVVTMSGPGGVVPAPVISRNTDGIGENTIVWQPGNLPKTVSGDVRYTVAVSGIKGAGVPAQTTWTTTLFDPDVAGGTVVLSGPGALPRSGAAYAFTAVPGAVEHRLTAATAGAAGDVVEGAEDGTAGDLVAKTTGTYALRQAATTTSAGTVFLPRSGAKAFHLTFPPDGKVQSVEVAADYVLSAGSKIDYYNCFRWVFNFSRLSLEMSVDGGVKWVEIDGRNGAYAENAEDNYDNALWDRLPSSGNAPDWKLRSVGLGAYAGKVARFRFVFRPGSRAFTGEDTRFGCFVDDVKVTAARRLTVLGKEVVTQSSPFVVTEAALGVAMVPGTQCYLRGAPVAGTRRMGWSDPLMATVSSLTGYEGWVAGFYPGATGGAAGDDDKDGVSNLVEYVFGTNPLSGASGAGALPVVGISGGALRMNFGVSPTATGVTVRGQTSEDLKTWTDLTNIAVPPAHSYAVPVSGKVRQWMRVKVTMP